MTVIEAENQTRTSEAAGGIGRRSLLAALVAMPMALPAAAGASADPVFALIERHKALSAEYTMARAHPAIDNVDTEHEAAVLIDHTLAALVDGAEELLAFQPLSLPGVVAQLRYLSAAEDWEFNGRLIDEGNVAQKLCATIASAIEAITRRGDVA